MWWRSAHTIILAALTLFILGAAPWVVGAATRYDGNPLAAPTRAVERSAPPALQAIVGTAPAGRPLPAGFLGLSFEYGALEAYAGGNPTALNPVFVRLLRNLTPAPVLRIGGDSTDATWWPVRRVARPAGIRYALTPRWVADARALAVAVHARLILGVNLAVGRPSLAAAEARALLRGIGSRRVAALELGNEPDVYGVFPWYKGRHRLVFARDAAYGLTAYVRQIARCCRRSRSQGRPPPSSRGWPGFRRCSRPHPGCGSRASTAMPSRAARPTPSRPCTRRSRTC